MIPISPTELPALVFSPGKEKQPYHSQSTKIGWVQTKADKPGASFDLIIRDGAGRVKTQILNCKTETDEFGEMINLPTMVGENLELEVQNLKGADKLTLFLN